MQFLIIALEAFEMGRARRWFMPSS